MKKQDGIKQKLEDLGFSEPFCSLAQEMGYRTLEDILSETPEVLTGKAGFTYTWLGELSGVLQEKGLLHLLQPTPGKSRG